MSRTLTAAKSAVAIPSASPKDRVGRAFILAILFAAFGLRVFRLGNQSLWGDEAFSVYRAGQSLREITAAVPDERTLPPLYYYLLHLWVPLAGKSETAVRFPSVVFGVLAVVLLYALVRRTLGPGAATIAALIASLSPFWIYYAQETRTYALVTALLLLALYFLVRASLETSVRLSRLLWIAYVVAATLALYSFYLAGFGLAAGVIWLVLQRRNWPGAVFRGLSAQLAVAVLLAPLLSFTGRSTFGLLGQAKPAGPSLATIFQHLEVAFNVGTTIKLERVSPEIALAFALAGLGLIAAPRRFAFLWGSLLVVPVLATYAVSFVPQAGWERYFLPATPAWFALIASGLNAIRSWPARVRGTPSIQFRTVGWGVAALGLGGLFYAMTLSLGNYYFNPTYWRSNYRAAVQRVDGQATPDVAVLVNGPPNYPSFFYYYNGAIPEKELPEGGANATRTVSTLEKLASRYRGLWFVKYNPPDFDPGGGIETWLDQHLFQASSSWVENTTFSLYLTDDLSHPHVVATGAPNRTFGADAQLIGYRVSRLTFQNNDYLLVTLSWRVLRRSPDKLTIFAHLLDRNGKMIAQSDHEPVVNLRPTRTWSPGDVLDDRFALKLPTSDQSGLSLSVGLYRPDGSRLPIDGLTTPDSSLTFSLASP